MLGGALTQSVGWRSIFWINLPIRGAAMVLAARFVPESKAQRARRVDPVGQGLVLTALACLTYAVIEGPHGGWGSPRIVGLFAVAVLAGVALVVYEPRRVDPLLDLRFFRSVPFCSATLSAVCAFATFAGFLFLNALYLQQARGFSPLQTGLCTLPLAVMTMVCAPFSGRLVGTRGTRPPLLVAGAGIFLGTWMLTHLTVGMPLGWLLATYVVFGIGFGMVNPPITHTAVSGMPKAQAGVAAAVASTSRQVGGVAGGGGGGDHCGREPGAGRGFHGGDAPGVVDHGGLRRDHRAARVGVEHRVGAGFHAAGGGFAGGTG